jgi:mono/diheme cytochrome c family protein
MPRIAHMLRAVLCAPESEGAEMSMGLITGRIVTALAGAMGTLGLALAASPVSSPSDAAHAHWQLVETYCFECHNATDWAGGVAFDTMTVDAVPEDAKVWEAAIKKLKSGLMPPPGSKQPERGAVTSMISWLETTLDNGQATPYVGYVPLRRLNRREYANAIRDLVGLQIDPAAWLPQDPLKDDFDTNAELLQVTPAFMDQAVTAARALALQAVGDPKSVPLETTYGSPANMILSLAAAPATGSGNQQRYKDGMPFGTRGGMSVVHNFPADGEYVLTIGDMALARTVPNMEFRNTVIALLDGKEFWRTDIGGEEDHKAIDQKLDDAVAQINGRLKNIRFYATAGQHTVAVTFLRRSYAEDDGRTLLFQPNDDRRPANPLEGGQHRVHAVHAFQIKGPVKITGMSDSLSRQKIFICKPASPAEERPCAEKIVRNLAERAFRRPVTDEDVVPLMRFYDRTSKTEGFEAGVRESLAAILASPHFLYRAEASVDQGARELNDLELASRLSFFLWSSLPDDELLAVAKRNELSKPDVLAAQVRRMIADPKGISLTRDFGFQWLNVAKLDTIVPSAALFRHASGVYDPREAFKKELELFMDSILRSDRPVTDLLTADHTYLNEQIALIYGMEDVRGNGFHKVKLKDPNRHGLLGKGAILMLTGAARCVDHGAHPRHTAGRSATERAGPERGREGQAGHGARANGDSPPGSCLCQLPRRDGSARIRAGKLRHGGRLPHHRPAVPPAHRLAGGHARWHAARRPRGPAQGARRTQRPVRADHHREADDLCAGPARRPQRHADGASDRARSQSPELHVRIHRDGRGEQRCVPSPRALTRTCSQDGIDRHVIDRLVPDRRQIGHVPHQEAPFPAHRPQGRWCGHLAAAAGRDDSGPHGPRQNRGGHPAPPRVRVHPARRGGKVLGAPGHGPGLRVLADPEADGERA